MHVFFSGIGGTGIGPLALIAHQAGFIVSGSDKQDSSYIHYLREKGISDITIGQTYEQIAQIHTASPIDWFVYTSALPIEHPDAPELRFVQEHTIRASKRDAFLKSLLRQKQLQLIAIAGTHGKTTTTAMTIWLLQQLQIPVSYSVGAKIPFGDMGHYEQGSGYFVYEADEYDRNFLAFQPYLSLITGIDWDHPDTYPTREAYTAAFRAFLQQSNQSYLWQADADRLGISSSKAVTVLDPKDFTGLLHLLGRVNRENGALVLRGLMPLLKETDTQKLARVLDAFPGVSRRFEQLVPNLYTDYAHTPPKIRGALQQAQEAAGDNVVVVYEGLHNTRQHFIKKELAHLFDHVKQLYIVPSYLAREDTNLELLQPAGLKGLLSPTTQAHTEATDTGDHLQSCIRQHLNAGDLVLCLTAGGGGSLDEWLRRHFPTGSNAAKSH